MRVWWSASLQITEAETGHADLELGKTSQHSHKFDYRLSGSVILPEWLDFLTNYLWLPGFTTNFENFWLQVTRCFRCQRTLQRFCSCSSTWTDLCVMGHALKVTEKFLKHFANWTICFSLWTHWVYLVPCVLKRHKFVLSSQNIIRAVTITQLSRALLPRLWDSVLCDSRPTDLAQSHHNKFTCWEYKSLEIGFHFVLSSEPFLNGAQKVDLWLLGTQYTWCSL